MNKIMLIASVCLVLTGCSKPALEASDHDSFSKVSKLIENKTQNYQGCNEYTLQLLSSEMFVSNSKAREYSRCLSDQIKNIYQSSFEESGYSLNATIVESFKNRATFESYLDSPAAKLNITLLELNPQVNDVAFKELLKNEAISNEVLDAINNSGML